MNKKIGIIGMGIMGSAMAKNLKKAGFDITVYNRTAEKTLPLKDMGCKVAKTPKEIAGETDITIVIVTNPSAVENVLTNTEGWFKGECKNKVLVNMSTVGVEFTTKLNEMCRHHEVKLLDCPVSGSKVHVESASLVVLAGGDQKEIEKIKPMFLKLAKAVIYAGPVPNGSALKLCMNLITAQMTTATAESVVLANTLQINPKLIFDVIKQYSALNCGYFDIKSKNVLNDDYRPAFSLGNMLKDVKFMIREAGLRNQKLPVTESALKLMETSAEQGYKDKDLSVIAKTLVEKYGAVKKPVG
ncbi:MAG TPA: NAD(P)-dependent oxidoreductase [Elusimicrobiales bacterium]|nr:NAD(P)-dependent oxidoreductase [Elusimicrobiales bacterium]